MSGKATLARPLVVMRLACAGALIMLRFFPMET
jgi:hypothetical protein